jgi:hypothetical protein
MSNYPDGVKWVPGDDSELLCEKCDAPVEGEAYESWTRSLEPDEDGGLHADPLLCWVHYAEEMEICSLCEGALVEGVCENQLTGFCEEV